MLYSKNITFMSKQSNPELNILANITNYYNVESLNNTLKKLIIGYLSSPLEITPEERLDIAIHYEALDSFLTQLSKLQH